MSNVTPDWVYAVQRFIHFDLPRASVYTFEPVTSSFSVDQRYIEGVANYSFLLIAGLLSSVLLIILAVSFADANIIEYSKSNVSRYKKCMFIYGFLSLIGTIVAFVGFTVFTKSMRKIIRDQLIPSSDIIREFHHFVGVLTNYSFGLLRDTKNDLKNAESESWWQDMLNKGANAIAMPVIDNILENEPKVKNLQKIVEDILDLIQEITSFMKYLLIPAVLYMLITLLSTAWITLKSLGRKGTGPYVCRLAMGVLISWWIVGAIITPIVILLSDVCFNPVTAMAKVASSVHPAVDEQLFQYYGNCIEPNPIKPYIDMLDTAVTYILGPMAIIIQRLGLMDPAGDGMNSLRGAKYYMEYVVANGGCDLSSKLAASGFKEVCTNLIMGLAFLTISSIIIAASLTFAVMACVRLRKFKGWKKDRLYPCPSTCFIHREFKEPPEPCRPRPVRSEIIWPKPKEYDRRVTCPITCRGHDTAKAELNLRTTCARTCRGMLPGAARTPRVLPKHLQHHYIKQKVDKMAVCCIDPYRDVVCEQETTKCECQPKTMKDACGLKKCQLSVSKALSTCGKYKCRFVKKKKKPPEPCPTKDPKECGIEKCQLDSKTSNKLLTCAIAKCKRRRRKRAQPSEKKIQRVRTIKSVRNVNTPWKRNPAEPAQILDRCPEPKTENVSEKSMNFLANSKKKITRTPICVHPELSRTCNGECWRKVPENALIGLALFSKTYKMPTCGVNMSLLPENAHASPPGNAHVFVYENTPRFTLFDFEFITAQFDFLKGDKYWQGLANYALWVLAVVLFLNTVIALYGLYVKVICLERPYRCTRRVLMSVVSSIGFICLKLVILAFLGVLMAYLSWNKLNSKLLADAPHNAACPYVRMLQPLPTVLTGALLKGAAAKPRAETVAAAIGNENITAEVANIDVYIANINDKLDNLTNATQETAASIEDLCVPDLFTAVLIPGEDETFFIALALCLWTAVLSFLITRSITTRSKNFMTILAVLAWITISLWGVLASVAFAGFLALADVCYDPFHTAEEYLLSFDTGITKELTGFYISCRDPNPLKENFTILYETLEPLVEDADNLTKVFELHVGLYVFGAFAREFNSALQNAIEMTNKVKDADCRETQKKSLEYFFLPCHEVFWGLGTIFVTAVLLSLFLAAFIMICMRIRKFLYAFVPPKPPPRPEDACPYTCPGPESDLDTPLYFMPECPKPPEGECPPSCDAFPAILRLFTSGLSRKQAARAERFACSPDCKKMYCDERGYILPPECIPVEDKSVETENQFMCTQTIKHMIKQKKRTPSFDSKLAKTRLYNYENAPSEPIQEPTEEACNLIDNKAENSTDKNTENVTCVNDNTVNKTPNAPKGFKIQYYSISKHGKDNNLTGTGIHTEVIANDNLNCKLKTSQDNRLAELDKSKYDNVCGKQKSTQNMKITKVDASSGVKCRNCYCTKNLYKAGKLS